MPRVTGKLQITLPKRLAETLGIQVGDELDITAWGNAIRIIPARLRQRGLTAPERLQRFDEATERIKKMNITNPLPVANETSWTRNELSNHGRAR